MTGVALRAWLARWPGAGRLGPLALLLGMALTAGSIWGFLELAEKVMAGETRGLDEAILLALRNRADLADPLGPGWLEEMGRDFTALGGVGVLALLSLAAGGYLMLCGHRRAAAFMAIALGGGWALSQLLKLGYDRPRPDLVPHGSIVYTTSFPSGHSMMAAVTYLTLAVMLMQVLPQRRLKAYLLAVAVLTTLLVGVSRVYLGVHWPTDVLAGWSAGAAWAALCFLGAQWLQRRGKMERPREEA